jgi:L,D-peptidoglycan transpeptidase YkuD (ErfK/YbiS/YcfS/YnhG family)
MYGIAANPGVHYAYHQLVCGDWWDEDPASPQYNTFQHVGCSAPALGGQSERLWLQTVAYQSFVVIDYNTGPVVPGRGSGVFLHYDTGGTTAGCVSVAANALVTLLRWLQPASSPLVVIGTDAQIRRF